MTGVAQQKRRNARKKAAARNPNAPRDPQYGTQFPEDRRQFITIRKRSGVRGYGAAATKVAISRAEDLPSLTAVINDFVAGGESFLNSDGFGPYKDPGAGFLEHRQANHSVALVGPNGENNNLSEELNFRMDRAEQGVYLNLEPKYLLDYAVETAFRADTRRMPNGSQLQIALHLALNVGLSHYWRGFTHGRHSPADRPRDAILDRRPAADLRGRIPALHGVQGNDFPFGSKRAQRATDGITAPALMIKLGEEGQLPPHLDLAANFD